MKKPFVKYIPVGNRGYVYDVNRNEVLPMSYKDYKLMLKGQYTNKDILELKKKGYFSSNRVEEIESLYMNDYKTLLERNIQKITLQITQNCNFRCKYCNYTENDGSQRVHSKRVMSDDILKKSIDFLMKNSVDSENVDIAFYGGEPLIEFEKIKNAVEYIEREYQFKKHSYSMTTNFSLITREMVEFFMRYSFNLMVSIDGIKETHDKNRKFINSDASTFDVIINKLSLLSNEYPKFIEKLSINIVMDPSCEFDKYDQIFDKYPIFNKVKVNVNIIDDTGNLKKNRFTKI